VGYAIEVTPRAQRDLVGLRRKQRERVVRAIDGLAEEPRPPGSKLLKGKLQDHRRIRVGSFRVLYQVFDQRLVVLVVRVRDRKDVYR